MNFNKKDIEKVLGCEINSFEMVPQKDGDTVFKIKVTPKKSMEFVTLNFKVLPTGAKFE